MGYLLKEALKTLCGVNRWTYAAFWKIGCRNPKLLIWEECYYEPLLSPDPSRTSGGQLWGKIQSLIDQMMVKNQIIIIGEGIIGRAAFMGNHQWIVSKNLNGDTHPPEVLNEMHDQFSAGIETVAVIPVSTHGVVQIGSSLSIMEDIGFVNNVRSLILQLGCIPNAHFSKNYSAKVGAPVSHRMPYNVPSDNYKLTGYMVSGQASQPSAPAGNVHDTLTPSVFQNFNHLKTCQPKASPDMKMSPPFQERSEGSFLRADEVPPNPDGWCSSLTPVGKQAIADVINQNLLSNNDPQMRANEGVSHESLQLSDSMLDNTSRLTSPPCFSPLNAINHPKEDMHDSSKLEGFLMFNITDHALSGSSSCLTEVEFPKNEDGHMLMGVNPSQWVHQFEKQDIRSQSAATNIKYEETSFEEHFKGDDLFDILGVELKNKILGGSFHPSGEKHKVIPILKNMQEDSPDFCAISEDLYVDGGIFSGMSSDDHLLDAIVSSVHSVSKQSPDDNLSCKTTLTKMSSSSVPSYSPTFHEINMSPERNPREIFGTTEPVQKVRNPDSPAFNSGFAEKGTCSVATSFCGSQISSWVEQNHAVKGDNSVSTGYSKRPNGVTKPNRKRLKLGENPRPRPKDRQMIQDRLKELRELVPNGAKCSIDALLERTIRHMLFLQSVKKHADNLKQSGESKERRLLLKDNFDRGATWAFEVGSQSTMVCPIIVEDLNPPRQMLVEMLCEDRGLFLKTAEMIRGLGLTILKGVMESRNDKVWAQFAVEADRDLTRMEIFMSLVHLLDQTAKNTETNPVGPLHSFSAATIPATCGPH